MAEPYVGQIAAFGFSFVPRGYAACEGQIMPISGNDAIFSLIGTLYGGDGRTSFAVPDLRGRLPIHMGEGPGLTYRPISQRGGVERVTLTTEHLPAHTHDVLVKPDPANSGKPALNFLAEAVDMPAPYGANNVGSAMADTTIGKTGGTQSHYNMMPSLTINFSIALQGTYPQRP